MEVLLVRAINLFFVFLEWMIFARIILSWVRIGYNSSIGRFLYNITEPILGPVRDMVDKSPLGGGYGLDFSPIFALILMRLVQTLLISGVQMIF
ncbi:MAG: YggT family protein [Anaerotignum sp.]|nr:YggT family protein [Anaerotignum sp.]MBQ2924814.1 YggT family protein [Anaerotignum sp.]